MKLCKCGSTLKAKGIVDLILLEFCAQQKYSHGYLFGLPLSCGHVYERQILLSNCWLMKFTKLSYVHI